MTFQLLIYSVTLLLFPFLAVKRLFADFLPRFLGYFILIWGIVVIVALLLSLFDLLGNSFAWHIGCLLLGGGAWLLVHKKTPLALPVGEEHVAVTTPGIWRRTETIFYLSTLALFFAVSLFVVIRCSISNWDTLTYHLPRVFFYISQGNLEHFYTPNFRQVGFPFNGTLFLIALAVQGASGAIFTAFNLSCWVIVGMAVYAIARLGGLSGLSSLAGTWLGLCATVVLAEATSTTNDIQLAAALMVGIYFVFFWIKQQSWNSAVLGAVALGLAAGTKVNFAFFIPPAALMVLIEWRKVKQMFLHNSPAAKKRLYQFLCAMIIIISLASPYLLYNYAATKTFIPGGSMVNKLFAATAQDDVGVIESRAYASGQAFITFATQFLLDPLQRIPGLKSYDPTMLTWNNTLEEAIAPFFSWWHSTDGLSTLKIFNYGLSENDVWFGWAAWPVTVAVIFTLFASSVRRTPWFWFAFLALGSFLTCCIMLKWGLYFQRYFITSFLIAGLAAAFMHHKYTSNQRSKIWFTTVWTLFAVLVTINAVHYILSNDLRPLGKALSPYSKARDLVVPEKLERHLAAAAVLRFTHFDLSHIDERQYQLMIYGREQKFFNDFFGLDQTNVPSLINLPGTNIISYQRLVNNFIYDYKGPLSYSFSPSAAFAAFPIDGKKTAGVEYLGAVGHEGEKTSYLYYSWPETGLKRQAGADDDRIMLVVMQKYFDDDKIKNLRLALLGLAEEDNATVRIYALMPDNKLLPLWSCDKEDWLDIVAPDGYQAIIAIAEDKISNKIIGVGKIFISALNKQITANMLDIVNDPDDVLATLKLENFRLSEGPYPQWGLDYCRWMQGRMGSLLLRNNTLANWDKAVVSIKARSAVDGVLYISVRGKTSHWVKLEADKFSTLSNVIIPLEIGDTKIEVMFDAPEIDDSQLSVLFSEFFIELFSARQPII